MKKQKIEHVGEGFYKLTIKQAKAFDGGGAGALPLPGHERRADLSKLDNYEFVSWRQGRWQVDDINRATVKQGWVLHTGSWMIRFQFVCEYS